MTATKKILLIAYNFPPLMSPQSLRWYYLSRELSKLGHRLDVLTVKMPQSFQDLRDDMTPAVQTHRTFPGPFYYVTFKYSRESPSGGSRGRESIRFDWRRMVFPLYLKLYRILNAVCVPDIYVEWVPFAVRAGLRLMRSHAYDILISSSEPRTCHVVGSVLKDRTGIRWIGDYGDPWIYPVPTMKEPPWKRRHLGTIEASILRRMDAITVAAEGIRQCYLDRYPFLNSTKVHVIEQGFDPDLFSTVQEETSSRFRIVYCGSLYKNLRDPTVFFHALGEIDLRDIEVIIAGRINEFADPISRGLFGGNVIYRGFLNHKDTLALEKGATVLLHIGNTTDTQIPGKIYEYLGARRPILGIRGGVNDASARLIMSSERGIAVNNDKDEIQTAVRNLYEHWLRGSLERTFNLDPVEAHTWRAKAEALRTVLDSM